MLFLQFLYERPLLPSIEQIKDCLGIRAKGRKIHGGEDEYQLREGQSDYGGWHYLDSENSLNWNLAN